MTNKRIVAFLNFIWPNWQ